MSPGKNSPYCPAMSPLLQFYPAYLMMMALACITKGQVEGPAKNLPSYSSQCQQLLLQEGPPDSWRVVPGMWQNNFGVLISEPVFLLLLVSSLMGTWKFRSSFLSENWMKTIIFSRMKKISTESLLTINLFLCFVRTQARVNLPCLIYEVTLCRVDCTDAPPSWCVCGWAEAESRVGEVLESLISATAIV